MKEAPPLAPLVFAEVVLLFDCDFPIEKIDTLLGLCPTESKRQSHTRINPLTMENNPGYWLFRTKTVSSFDSGPLLREIDNFFMEHASKLHLIIQRFSPCSILLRFRILVRQENEYPAIRFNPEMLERISAFDATIDIDIENDAMFCVEER